MSTSGRHFIAVTFFLCSQIFAMVRPDPAQGQQAGAILNYFPTGAEVAGRAPGLFSYLRDDLFVLVDPLDAHLVIVSGTGRIEGGSGPLSIVPTRVRATDRTVEFIEDTTGRRVVLPRDVDPAQLGSPVVQDAAPEPAIATTVVTRVSARHLKIKTGGNTATNKTLNLHSLAGGHLSDAQYLGQDLKGRFYVQTSEIAESNPRINVKVFVQRLTSAGAFDAAASVPVAAMDVVPGRFVAVSPVGQATLLFPTSKGLFLQKLQFQDGRGGHLAPASVAPLTPIDAVVHEVSLEPPTPKELAPAEVIPHSTRAQIIDRANAYLTVNWTMTRANFEHSDVENLCSKRDGKYWLRPHRLSESSIGKTLSSMPYYWGGDDTPSSFLSKIAAGSLAGNVCTCREKQYDYCQVRVATGVDCSGFVSRSWGISKHGTAELQKVAKPIPLSQLRPGDVLDKPGSHVRLFVKYLQAAETKFEVLESATHLGCEGVCRSVYGATQLQGYQPLRFMGVDD